MKTQPSCDYELITKTTEKRINKLVENAKTAVTVQQVYFYSALLFEVISLWKAICDENNSLDALKVLKQYEFFHDHFFNVEDIAREKRLAENG